MYWRTIGKKHEAKRMIMNISMLQGRGDEGID